MSEMSLHKKIIETIEFRDDEKEKVNECFMEISEVATLAVLAGASISDDTYERIAELVYRGGYTASIYESHLKDLRVLSLSNTVFVNGVTPGSVIWERTSILMRIGFTVQPQFLYDTHGDYGNAMVREKLAAVCEINDKTVYRYLTNKFPGYMRAGLGGKILLHEVSDANLKILAGLDGNTASELIAINIIKYPKEVERWSIRLLQYACDASNIPLVRLLNSLGVTLYKSRCLGLDAAVYNGDLDVIYCYVISSGSLYSCATYLDAKENQEEVKRLLDTIKE